MIDFRTYAPVAQLDRAPGFEPVGRGFKSLRARSIDPRGFAPRIPLHAHSLARRATSCDQSYVVVGRVFRPGSYTLLFLLRNTGVRRTPSGQNHEDPSAYGLNRRPAHPSRHDVRRKPPDAGRAVG